MQSSSAAVRVRAAVPAKPAPAAATQRFCLSVVIPALNEAACIHNAVSSALHDQSVHEVVVVDGGSCDDTWQVATRAGARVVRSQPGRGIQLQAGATAATGDSLLFLHADTVLPHNYASMVDQTLADPACAAGAFTLRIDARGWQYRVIERGVAWRSGHLHMPYGDQAIFLRRETLQSVGGIQPLPTLEDFHLIRSLRRMGSIRILDAAVTTSSRRWERDGIVRTTLKNVTRATWASLHAHSRSNVD
ncbi:MAG: TIGR04283 family arsenosugar biosynthesis glycosyltransferase [Phycisphaerales bacterium]